MHTPNKSSIRTVSFNNRITGRVYPSALSILKEKNNDSNDNDSNNDDNNDDATSKYSFGIKKRNTMK